jgi:hypothetical protein
MKWSLPFKDSDTLLDLKSFTQWCQRNLPENPPTDASLRFDGLYHSITHLSSDKFLRFYPEGTVISASISKPATAEEIGQWFGKGHDYSSVGEYKRSGAQIGFTTVYQIDLIHNVVVDHIGAIIDSNTICLESYSHATKHRDLQYFFFERVEYLVP